MKSLSKENLNIRQADEKLGQTFYTNGRYNAIFLGAAGIGFVVIYILTYFEFLGERAPQLLYISGAIFLMAGSQIPILNLARQKRGIAANFLASLSVAIFAVLLTFFWEGIVPVAFLLVFITPLASIPAGMPRKYYPYIASLIIASSAVIFYANTNPLNIERLQTGAPAAIASLAFLGATGALLITITVVARSPRYRSLRNQLVISFVIIVTIPTLMATVLSAIGTYINNEAQVLNVLKTISQLKESQINAVIDKFKLDADRISQDSGFSGNAIDVLTSAETDEQTVEQYRSLARARLLDFRNADQSTYAEIMVLDINGDVAISTDITREGKSFQSESFYREGGIDTFVGFSKNPTFGDADLMYATPFYDTDGEIFRGILVLRVNSNLIINIVESIQSFADMETYLLDEEFSLLTATRSANTGIVCTLASISLMPVADDGVCKNKKDELKDLLPSRNVAEGADTYENYKGDIVLGYYQRIESLNTAFIAEVPRAFVQRSSINSLLSSAILAVFAIAIAIAAVAISAASITEPISALAKIAESFAAGKFSLRASINRQDEIGALGNAYDKMAGQLEDIIGTLEKRVTDRTQELEDQTLRLRVSAEIARDAAASHSLTELLDKASSLIQERFELYHTGIFLLDSNKEFAVLTASPTQAGKEMIANNHKLRVGEVGIVGRVAYSEEPRITHDTGTDAVFFNNPLLPKTHSEMALPLKVENRMIGVLDVQSDRTQAFKAGDITIMQILADQLATAIERARLLEQVEQNLRDLEQAYGQFTREGWKSLGESGLLGKTGYRFDNIRIQPITEIPEHGNDAMKTGATVIRKNNSGDNNQVVIPIKLRGQTIGVVSANLKDGYTQNTVSTLELAIERLALSLESTRLYEEARIRADREQTIAHVTSSISTASGFDAILRTTVEEIGKSLGDLEVSIQILSDTGEHK